MWRGVGLLVAVVATLTVAPGAGASPSLAIGAVENQLMWNTADTVAVARYLGLKTIAISLEWEPRMADLEPSQIDGLNRAVVAAGSVRIVLGIHNNWTRTPTDAAGRQRFCDYAANALRRYPQINDIIVWNEPNVGFFWQPQFDASGASAAPRGYFELAAHCYDVLHAVRPGVNVVGPVNSHWGNDNPNAASNVTHSPTRFLRALGAAYRASGRTRPIFDTLGHHPYPRRSDEPPSLRHEDPAVISIGDTARLLEVMREAFGGTGQPIPQEGLPIWYLETGYRTTIADSKQAFYDGVFENWPGPVPDVDPGGGVDQAKQLTDSLRLMYCQPYVEAIFNFLLKDEPQMSGWQSGVFWADGTPKGSLEAYRSVIQEVNERRVNCSTVPGGPAALATANPRGVSSGSTGGSGGAAGGGAPSAQRAVTKLTYTAAKQAVYGRLRLRAQLTRGVTRSDEGLANRHVTFVVDGEAYVTTTDARGFASLAPTPPIRPGTHRVQLRFRGDSATLGTGARVDVRVLNSRGSVRSNARLRLSPKLRATFAARSDGTTVRGTLTLRRSAPHRVRLNALGVAGRGRLAWLSGTDGSNRYDVHLRRLTNGRVRVQIWRNGVELHRAVTVSARLVRIRG